MCVRVCVCVCVSVCVSVCVCERERDRQTDRQTETLERDRETETEKVVFTKGLSYTDPPCIVVCGVGACKSVYLVLCVSPSSFSSLLKARHGTRGGGGAGRETQLEGRDFLREYW